MMLGKRQRPPLRRTTSLSEITFDLNPCFNDDVKHHQSQNTGNDGNWRRPVVMAPPPPAAGVVGSRTVDGLNQNWLLSTVSPINHKRNSSDFVETAHFLRACSLCERRLVPGRDIYMYRGDSAFCSLECRQQQMNQDERKEKCSLTSKRQVPVPTAASHSQVAAKGETVAAL